MMAMGALTLLVIYRLVRSHYERWIAVCVTTGVGINISFLEQSHELMTDLPFLLGVCTTLLGVGKLTRWRGGAALAGAALLTAAGAALAIAMRPTFWALAIAIGGTCVIGLFRSRRRWWYAGGMVALAAVLLCWQLLDPRGSPLNGRYEQTVLAHLKTIGSIEWRGKLAMTIDTHLPEAILGFEVARPLGILLLAGLVAGSIALMRHTMLWGLYVLVTLLMTIILGSVPRYYLMILPFVLAGWALTTRWIAAWCKQWPREATALTLWGVVLPALAWLAHIRPVGMPRSLALSLLALVLLVSMAVALRSRAWIAHVLLAGAATGAMCFVPVTWAFIIVVLAALPPLTSILAAAVAAFPWREEMSMLWGLGLPTVVNVFLCFGFVMAQHGIDRSFHRQPFLEVYRGGKMLPLASVAREIKARVPPGQTVLGPEAQILTFLGGRNVFQPSDLLENPERYPWEEVFVSRRMHQVLLACAAQPAAFRQVQADAGDARRSAVHPKACQVTRFSRRPPQGPPFQHRGASRGPILESPDCATRPRLVRLAEKPAGPVPQGTNV